MTPFKFITFSSMSNLRESQILNMLSLIPALQKLLPFWMNFNSIWILIPIYSIIEIPSFVCFTFFSFCFSWGILFRVFSFIQEAIFLGIRTSRIGEWLDHEFQSIFEFTSPKSITCHFWKWEQIVLAIDQPAQFNQFWKSINYRKIKKKNS